MKLHLPGLAVDLCGLARQVRVQLIQTVPLGLQTSLRLRNLSLLVPQQFVTLLDVCEERFQGTFSVRLQFSRKGHDVGREAEPLRNRQPVRPPWYTLHNPVGRLQMFGIELQRCVDRPFGFRCQALELMQMGGRKRDAASVTQRLQHGPGQRSSFGRIRAGAELVEQDEGVVVG